MAFATGVVVDPCGVAMEECLLSIDRVENISLSALSLASIEFQGLDVIGHSLAITQKSEQEFALHVAPALISPVESDLDGWFAVELSPRFGWQVVANPTSFVLEVGLVCLGELVRLDNVLGLMFADVFTDEVHLVGGAWEVVPSVIVPHAETVFTASANIVGLSLFPEGVLEWAAIGPDPCSLLVGVVTSEPDVVICCDACNDGLLSGILDGS